MYSNAGHITLERVLSFFSGAEEIPPNRHCVLIQPCLNFNNIQPHPTASTCAIALTLPTKYYDQPYDAFKRAINTATTCHSGFGLVWPTEFSIILYLLA